MHIYVYIYIHAHNILYRYLQVLRMWICLHYVHGPKAPCLSGESWMVPEPREARRHDWWHGCDTVPGMKSYMTGMERSEKNIWKYWKLYTKICWIVALYYASHVFYMCSICGYVPIAVRPWLGITRSLVKTWWRKWNRRRTKAGHTMVTLWLFNIAMGNPL